MAVDWLSAGVNLIDMALPKTTTTSGSSSGNVIGKTKTTQQRVLSAEAMNKIMSDILGSEQGLASLATGENVSGSFGSTGRTQLTQDFLTKVAGELAVLTAPTVTEADTNQVQQSTQQQTSKSKRTVICTELVEQGMFPLELYNHPAALAHFINLDQRIVEGYHAWAVPVVRWMKKSPRLSRALRPIVIARYLQIVYGDRSILGSLTIYVGQPICWMIGAVLRLTQESENGSRIY